MSQVRGRELLQVRGEDRLAAEHPDADPQVLEDAGLVQEQRDREGGPGAGVRRVAERGARAGEGPGVVVQVRAA